MPARPLAVFLLLSLSPGLASAGRASWSYESLGAIWAAPLTAPDGRVLVGSEDGYFYGFAPGGRLLWSYKASEGFSGWPAWTDRSTFAVGNRNGTLYFFDLDGKLLGKTALGGAALGPAASAPGRLYLATTTGLVAVSTRDRRLLWSHPVEGPSSWVAAGPGGRRVYLGCRDGSVISVDDRGDRRSRTVIAPSPVRGGLVADRQGVVAATANAGVVALDPEGKERWRFTGKQRIDGGLAALPKGGVVFGSDDGVLTALDAEGRTRWRFSADAALRSTPVVTSERILIGSEAGAVYLLDLAGRPRSLFFASGPVRGAASFSGGRVLYGSQDRRLYVISLADRRASAPTGLRAALASTPAAPLLWRSELSGPVASGVGPGAGQTLLCGTWGKQIYSLGPAGGVRWTHNCGEDVDTLPAPTPGGGVVFGCGDGGFYGLKPDGELLFRYPVNKGLSSSPAVARDGTIYFGAGDKRIYALTPAGKVLWKIRTGDDVDGAPRIGPDGVVYIGSDDGHLYAVGPTGHLTWYFRSRGAVRGRAAIAKDGTVFVGSFDQSLYAIAPNGMERWSFQTDGQIAGSPLLGPDGTVYQGSRDHHLYAIDSRGKLRWRFETAGEVDAEPALAADGSVIIGSDDGRVYALDPVDGRPRWWFAAGAEIRGKILARPDGSVVFGTMDGAVIAVAAPGSEAARGVGAGSRSQAGARVLWRGRIGRGRTGPLLPLSDGGVAIAGADGVLRLYGSDRWPASSSRIGANRLSAPVALGDDLYLTDASGSLARVSRSDGPRWRLRVERSGVGAPAVLPGEAPLLLCGSRAGRLWAVRPEGTVAWFWSGAEPILEPPAVLPSGSAAVIAVAGGREVTGIDRNGQRVFSFRSGAGIEAGPIRVGDLFLVGDGRGTLSALDTRGKRVWERDLGSGIAGIVPGAEATTLAVRTEDGRLLELGIDGEPLLEWLAPSPLTAIAAGPGSLCAVAVAGAVSWVARGSGGSRPAIDLASSVLDLALQADGSALLATAGGELVVLEAGGGGSN